LESPFADFDQARREVLRLFDAVAGNTSGETASGVFPPINVSQDDDSFYVRAELPGIRASELGISALAKRITISGKREIPQEHERVSYHRRERAEGSFSRTLALPTEIDSSRVEARYSDGILDLRLPKAEQAKPRQITVKT
jgi:HSP20 family protein